MNPADPTPAEPAATPRTDALLNDKTQHHNGWDFARKLEQQRDALKREVNEARVDIARLELRDGSVTRGINELWKLLELAGYVPCNNGWLDESRKALNELTALRATLTKPSEASELLDFLENEAGALEAVSTPIADTGDFSGHWQVIEYHMAKPTRRVIGTGATPRAALLAARSATGREPEERT